jgi:DnaA family protein
MIGTQLTLALFKPPRATFEAFVPGRNGPALRALHDWVHGAAPWCVGLWGAPGTGKSHLLQAAVRAAHTAGLRAMYLPLAELTALAGAVDGPALLEDLDRIDALALDDLSSAAGDPSWEVDLFALYNRCQARGARLLFALPGPPAASAFALADLRSRLSAALIYQLQELADADKARVLQALARARGLTLGDAVTGFLLRRLPRSLHDLVTALDALDRASLRDHRSLTVPFVRSALNLEGDP